MKVSIITTVFNRSETIRFTIESVLSQDYSDIEYIVIDGASTDGSMAIIEEYKDRLSHIVSEPDGGMYEAINKGLRLATGDVVGLLHSDDLFYDNNVISKIVAAFEQSGCDLVYGNGYFETRAAENKIVRTWISGPYDYSRLSRGWLPLHTTVYLRRELILRNGLYEEDYRIASDTAFLLRYLYIHKVKSYYLDAFVVRMRIGGISTKLSNTLTKWGEDMRAYRNCGLNPYLVLPLKVLSKVPQFFHR